MATTIQYVLNTNNQSITNKSTYRRVNYKFIIVQGLLDEQLSTIIEKIKKNPKKFKKNRQKVASLDHHIKLIN
jgi:hypothetical protein